MKRALFIAGGWDGHQPGRMASLLADQLGGHGFHSDIMSSLDVLDDPDHLAAYDLISPCWTMGTLSPDQSKNLLSTINAGVALAGIHGGMGDAFRGNLDYEWMVGGHFVGHPHVGKYLVKIKDFASPITTGLPGSFVYESEQYYLLIDPAVQVLAEADYEFDGRICSMPVAWCRKWGQGRVFYSALGHAPDELENSVDAMRLTLQGMLWAAALR